MGNGKTIMVHTAEFVFIVKPWQLLMVFWNEMVRTLICQMHMRCNAEYLRGLINVVPLRGAGDRAGSYCIGRFAIDMHCKLLENGNSCTQVIATCLWS